MNIILQEALEKDYNEINRIFLYVHKHHIKNRPDLFKASENFFSKEEYNKIISNPKKKIIKVLWDENIVGACMFEIISIQESTLMYERKVLSIDIIGINPIFQKKGIGTFIINYLKEYKTNHNISTIQLTTWDFNISALEFYEKNNFKRRNYRFEYI